MLDIKSILEPIEFVHACQKTAEQFELEGRFNEDVNENSMDGAIPVTEDFPFIRKGFKFNFKKFFYLLGMKIYTNKAAKLLKFEINGKENLKKLKNTGCIVTCNHISLYDSFAVRKAIGNDIMYVAAEFNNWKGKMGEIARHTGYIPVASKISLMRKFDNALKYYLDKKKKILFYPEQACWRNYEKPRPLKDGAFHYASKNNAPILPIFITFRPSNKTDKDIECYYTINILEPIFPKGELNAKENTEYLRKSNYQAWKTCYENFYNKTLEYSTIDKEKIKI